MAKDRLEALRAVSKSVYNIHADSVIVQGVVHFVMFSYQKV